MTDTMILFPSIIMALMTAAMMIYMGMHRRRVVRSKQVPIKYYQLYENDPQPDRVKVITRHLHNHFEMPPLFHLAVWGCFVTGSVTEIAIGLAWAYVLLRMVHSYIHLGTNNVTHRFNVFVVSHIVMIGLWLNLAFGLLTR